MQRYSRFKPRSIRRLERKTKRNTFWTLIISAVLVYALIAWVIPFFIGGLTFLDKFKPQTKPETIDQAITPPILNIPFESTNSATLNLTGFASSDSEVEIYVDDQLKDTVKTDSTGNFIAENIELNLGTNNITGKTVNSDGKKSLPSKNIRLFYSDEKPKLEILEPADNTDLKGGDKKVRVSGKTDPENNVSVNGSSVIVRNDGTFSTEVNLNDGDNKIGITVSNGVGNQTQEERLVKFTPQP